MLYPLSYGACPARWPKLRRRATLYSMSRALSASARNAPAGYAPAGYAPVARLRTSKNRAWLMTALSASALNGLLTRKVGSGFVPVSSLSG
jgi:hypothetical protein